MKYPKRKKRYIIFPFVNIANTETFFFSLVHPIKNNRKNKIYIEYNIVHKQWNILNIKYRPIL